MNTDKTGKLLRKIQALYENLSDQGPISALERDLILSYIREFYEDIAASPVTSQGTSFRHAPEPAIETPIVRPPAEVLMKKPEPPPPPVAEWRPPVEVIPEPVHISEPVDPATPEHPASHVSTTIPEGSVEQTSATVAVETPAQPKRMPVTGVDDELLALFEFKQIGELSEKLQLQPLDRLEHGMGINERILMINELFKGDGILFNQTLKDVDGMRSFEEARQYLLSGVATRFQWGEKPGRDQARLFIQLVRRRFLPAR